MSSVMKTVSISFVCLILLALLFDIKKAQQYKHVIKDALDLSTKAAALQIDLDPIKIGQGIFELKEADAKKTFENIFQENLGVNSKNYVLETIILNVHTLRDYTAPNGKKYKIDSPTIISSVKYPYKGILIRKDINVENLSASVIKNKNDLKGN